MTKRKNWFMITLILVGAILFGTVAFVVIRSTRTVTAVVPATTITTGVVIDNNMLTTIQVPVGTPKGYITNLGTLVGQKLRITAQPGQLLYMSDVLVSWDDVVYGQNVPDDYVVTAISISDKRALGGLITAGDTVDILGVVNDSGSNDSRTIKQRMQDYMGKAVAYSYGTEEGAQLYWLLSNVTILETNSSLSEADNGLISTVTGESSEGSFYIIALSYEDYMKLVLAQEYMTLWMNISPAWNNDNDPLLDVMRYAELKELMDSTKQSIIEETVNADESVTKSISEAWIKEYKDRETEWYAANPQYSSGNSKTNSNPAPAINSNQPPAISPNASNPAGEDGQPQAEADKAS